MELRSSPMDRTFAQPGAVTVSPGFLPAGEQEFAGYPAAFIARLQETLDRTRPESHQGALIIISVDNMPMILSGYGHHTAQSMMNCFIQDLRTILAPEDTVMRVQKDQIGILIEAISDQEASMFAERVASHTRHFGHQCDLGLLNIMSAVACIKLPMTSIPAELVLDHAYIAVKSGKGFVCRSYHEPLPESTAARQEMGLAGFLLRAIRENRLRLAYQPIIESETGKISHFEALLRVVGDDGSISSAGPLIPVAERVGLIEIIDEKVLEMVVEDLHRSPDVMLTFNVSNLSTTSSKWLRRFKELTTDEPEIARRMIVEITETAAHRDMKRTSFFVASVQSQGAQVALDDFGSGYTSFRQLKSLSVDLVKIDGAFVRDIVDNHDNYFFVKTLLDFTKAFKLKAVAEFVENGEIAKILLGLGVEYMQGYYFGKPENHRSWLKGGE